MDDMQDYYIKQSTSLEHSTSQIKNYTWKHRTSQRQSDVGESSRQHLQYVPHLLANDKTTVAGRYEN